MIQRARVSGVVETQQLFEVLVCQEGYGRAEKGVAKNTNLAGIGAHEYLQWLVRTQGCTVVINFHRIPAESRAHWREDQLFGYSCEY